MIIELSLLLALFLGVFGLLIGSFLNVCVYRLPRGESVVVGRSHCPSCGHRLGPADLVPVLSFLALGRRCRYCHQPISSRYATVEVLTAGLFFLSTLILSSVSQVLFFPVLTWIVLPMVDGLVLAALLTRSLIRRDQQAQPIPLKRWITRFVLYDILHLMLVSLILCLVIAR